MEEKQRELLLQLRSMLVGKLHTQPYTIYSDETIAALLKAQPKSLEELGKVKGFPPEGKRIKGFGAAVVKIFTSCEKITGFEVEGKGDAPEIGTKVKRLSAF